MLPCGCAVLADLRDWQAKRLDLLDETTLQRLISISQHAAATREEGAANVAYLEGRFGVVDSVDDEVLVQGGMLEEETAMEMSSELVALASPDLLRGRILPVGTSVEFDAVCDLSLGKWIVTRLVRQVSPLPSPLLPFCRSPPSSPTAFSLLLSHAHQLAGR